MAVSFTTRTNSTDARAASALPPAQPPGKLAKAAQEFEAILLTSWLEKMNQSFVGSEESQDAAHDTVSSLGTQAIASALAARGGIGIARMLLRQLQPAQPAAANTENPVVMEKNLAGQPSAGGEKPPEKD
jgi:Rod binding domain-containing protein